MSEIQFYKQLEHLKLFFVEECASTQDAILQAITDATIWEMGLSPNQSIALFTDFQLAGKGQNNNHWQSPKGENMMVTVAMQLGAEALADLVSLNKSISVSICKSLQNVLGVGHSLQIKWPNDLFYNNQKLGGLLMQVVQEKGARILVLGFGINVNQNEFEPELSKFAVSMKQILGVDFIIRNLLEQILHDCSLKKLALESAHADFTSLLWKRNHTVQLELNEKWKAQLGEHLDENGFLSGVMLGVDKIGRLTIALSNEETVSFNHGEARIAVSH